MLELVLEDYLIKLPLTMENAKHHSGRSGQYSTQLILSMVCCHVNI